MTRNYLLILSMRPHPATLAEARPGVWRMTMALLGRAFGVPAARRERWS